MTCEQVDRYLGQALALPVDHGRLELRVSAIDPIRGLVTVQVLTAGIAPARQRVPCSTFLQAIQAGVLSTI